MLLLASSCCGAVAPVNGVVKLREVLQSWVGGGAVLDLLGIALLGLAVLYAWLCCAVLCICLALLRYVCSALSITFWHSYYTIFIYTLYIYTTPGKH